MTQPVAQALLNAFPLTAPDLAAVLSPGGMAVDAQDDLWTETSSELQNLQQDLTNRLIETPGSNLDFSVNGAANNRGVGIWLFLGADTAKLASLPTTIDTEFERDPRVISSATTLATQPDGTQLVQTQVTTVSGVQGLSWVWSQSGLYPVPSS